jgi:hypothetical protein
LRSAFVSVCLPSAAVYVRPGGQLWRRRRGSSAQVVIFLRGMSLNFLSVRQKIITFALFGYY